MRSEMARFVVRKLGSTGDTLLLIPRVAGG